MQQSSLREECKTKHYINTLGKYYLYVVDYISARLYVDEMALNHQIRAPFVQQCPALSPPNTKPGNG